MTNSRQWVKTFNMFIIMNLCLNTTGHSFLLILFNHGKVRRHKRWLNLDCWVYIYMCVCVCFIVDYFTLFVCLFVIVFVVGFFVWGFCVGFLLLIFWGDGRVGGGEVVGFFLIFCLFVAVFFVGFVFLLVFVVVFVCFSILVLVLYGYVPRCVRHQ